MTGIICAIVSGRASLRLEGGTARHMTVAPTPASAHIIFGTDGTHHKSVGGVVTNFQNWYQPTTPGIGNFFWIKATYTGAIPTGSPTGVWLQLDSARTWGLARSSGESESDITVQLAADAAGAQIIATGFYNIQADSVL